MYTIDAGNSIEFFFKDDTIFELAKMRSAYKARALGAVDGINITSDEQDFAYNALKTIWAELFIDLEKQMVSDAYIGDTGTSHGADQYSGIFIHDNERYSTSLLILLDSMMGQAAVAGLLSQWYSLIGQYELAQEASLQYVTMGADLHNFAFDLRKPQGANIINFKNEIMSDRVLFTALADQATSVDHAINTSDYVVTFYEESTGKELEFGVVTREPGQFTVWSNVEVANVVAYIVGDRS